MIISRSKNLIFVRTRKVAGTSIEFALSRHCRDPDDVITPIRNDIERAAVGVWPRNFMRLPRLEDEYRAVVASGDAERVKSAQLAMRKDMNFWDHISARQIRDRVGEEFWRGAVKVSVIRDPYEFIVSQLHFQLYERGVAITPARRLVELLSIVLRIPRNIDVISIDGRIAVDRVLRYESLREELRGLAAIVGADISGELPHFKAGIRPSTATPESELGPWIRRLIAWRWRREFETFGY